MRTVAMTACLGMLIAGPVHAAKNRAHTANRTKPASAPFSDAQLAQIRLHDEVTKGNAAAVAASQKRAHPYDKLPADYWAHSFVKEGTPGWRSPVDGPNKYPVHVVDGNGRTIRIIPPEKIDPNTGREIR